MQVAHHLGTQPLSGPGRGLQAPGTCRGWWVEVETFLLSSRCRQLCLSSLLTHLQVGEEPLGQALWEEWEGPRSNQTAPCFQVTRSEKSSSA